MSSTGLVTMTTDSPRPVMDIDDRINSSGCGDVYRSLEECIVLADRDWRKCQSEVIEFRKCMDRAGRTFTGAVRVEEASVRPK